MEEHFLALPLLPLLPSSFSAATGNPSTSSSAGCVEGSLSCRETVSGRTRDRTASGQGNSSSTEEDIAALKKRRAKRQAKKAKRQQASKSGAQEPAIPQGITVEVVECDGKAGGDAEVEEVGERGEDFDEAPRRLADGVPTMDFLAKRVAVMMLKEGGPGMADSLSDIGSSKEVPVSKAILSAVPSTKTLQSAGLNLAGVPCTESEGLTLALPEKKSLEKKRSSTSSLPRDESPASRSGCDVPPIPGNRLAPKTAKQLKELIKEEKKAQKKALKALNKSVYEPYATPESILAHPGLYDGGLEKGTLVISQKSPDQAYVRLPGKPNDDINIANVLQRNRALSGDVVVVEIAPRTEWKVRPDFVEEVQTALGVDASGKRLAPSKNSVRTTGKKGGVSVPGAAQSVQACSSGGNQVRQSQNQGQKWMNILMENMDLADAPEQWLQKTGKVVCIVEASGTRQLVGKLGKVPTTNGVINPVVFRLSPTDSRMPDVSIRANEVPADLLPLLDSKKYLKEQLFLVDIMEWPENHSIPYGRIVKPIGVVGDVDTYTASILVENCVDETVLPAAVLEQIVKPFTNEMGNAAKDAGRQDFRGDCVFTIDPPDAKDLDDAVSCHALGNGIYSVGVHIADVSFYIAEGTPIDLYARQRGTSVYLVNKVVPMLPPKMIESVCSLDPGVERRTVSALFTITENGEVLDHFLTRGLIRSCAKLSYETAQRIIDDPYQVPTVALSASPSEADAIRQTILFLFEITQSLRRQRFERGKLSFGTKRFQFLRRSCLLYQVYEPYATPESILAHPGLYDGGLEKGTLVISQKSPIKPTFAFLERSPNDDINIANVLQRNRALSGDVVVVEIAPRTEWKNQGQKWMNILMENMDLADAPEQWLQKTGKVVCIVEASGTRQLVGKLGKVPTTNGVINPVVFRLSPTDSRMPDVSIRANEVPADLLPLLDSKKYLKEQLFLVDIMEWPETHSLPYGRIVKPIGVVGDVDTYTASILVENCIDETDAGRQDFRGDCVFTIDPPDAKDLDDAVSCHALGNGIYSVGVHIADVSFYIAEGTPIDLYARQRGTSVYLVNKMIESVCSLDPGVEATYRVGPVYDHGKWRGLGPLLDAWSHPSCAKLSYETAQKNHWTIDDPYQVPTVALSASPCEADAIRQTILFLFNITQSLRRQRFERGGLRIDQPEFRFDLDGNGLPVAMVERDRFASCQLIEELALLTNMATAGIIREHFPEIALLRRHPSPMQSGLLNLQKFCHMNNLDMWIDTSKSIQMSMSNIVALEPRLDPILSYLCAKPMKLAEYVCTGQEIDTWHYALNVEEYTHMTSPIRRYPDIVVHRLLLAALGYTARPQISPDEMQAIADQCNARKISAGRCQEASLNLFLGLFIQRSGPMLEDGVVVAVYPHSLSVEILVPRLGFVERVFCQRAEFVTNVCHRSAGRSEPGSVGPRSYLELNWAKKQLKGVLKLGVMTRVPVVLSVGNKDARKLKACCRVCCIEKCSVR
ncbi:DIS3-like exonuclease 2 [Hypsibius exemplaris]|uniref:DIS3-like exonuclease 2 n=1 Tax=Hypsibius exemplaris TaxID=2072580 RepID=A0A1W0WIT0_HYPEX|nr:DIS3-like exonuclease 2 [Hypsibius exemplaris]